MDKQEVTRRTGKVNVQIATLESRLFARRGGRNLLIAFVLLSLAALGPLAAPAQAVDGNLDDAYTTQEGVALIVGAPGVLANDGVDDGTAVQIDGYHALSHHGGSVSMDTDGGFRYTPPAGFAGYDAFAYTISDGQGGAVTAAVTIEVEALRKRIIAANLHSFELGNDRQSPEGHVLITNQSDGHDVQITDMAIKVQYQVQDGGWQSAQVVEESCRFGPPAPFLVRDQQLVSFYGCALEEPVPTEAAVSVTAEVETYGRMDGEDKAGN
jgi:hypothetical protein